jgi:hypothetical protein
MTTGKALETLFEMCEESSARRQLSLVLRGVLAQHLLLHSESPAIRRSSNSAWVHCESEFGCP